MSIYYDDDEKDKVVICQQMEMAINAWGKTFQQNLIIEDLSIIHPL